MASAKKIIWVAERGSINSLKFQALLLSHQVKRSKSESHLFIISFTWSYQQLYTITDPHMFWKYDTILYLAFVIFLSCVKMSARWTTVKGTPVLFCCPSSLSSTKLTTTERFLIATFVLKEICRSKQWARVGFQGFKGALNPGASGSGIEYAQPLKKWEGFLVPNCGAVSEKRFCAVVLVRQSRQIPVFEEQIPVYTKADWRLMDVGPCAGGIGRQWCEPPGDQAEPPADDQSTRATPR